MRYCQHCGGAYDAARSMAELRLTYCGLFCEGRDMVPVSQLLRAQRRTRLTAEEMDALVAAFAESALEVMK